MPIEHSIAAQTRGRYLVETGEPGHGMLVGFHGYGESAEQELLRLNRIKGAETWTRVAVQGLHRFYRRRSMEVVSSWMTSQDREAAIADNLSYVIRVIEAVQEGQASPSGIVLSGFSQGVAMAYRAACASASRVSGVIALCGDVAPELNAAELSSIPHVLVGCGVRDEWYTEEKLAADELRLRAAGVNLRVVRFEGGHEWTEEFGNAAAAFLKDVGGSAGREGRRPL